MLCSRPFRKGVVEFGCGQCAPCRMNRRRLWTARLMLEANKHQFSRFVTLTYCDEEIPDDKSVRRKGPKSLQEYIKRLRARVHPVKLRFYGVGEYGDITGRPHYHVALFGVQEDAHIVGAWAYGHVHVGTLTPESASYVVGYVTKGLTKSDDVRLAGRAPEFAQMSLNPGIGGDAVFDLAHALSDGRTGELFLVDGDVPTVFKSGGKTYPLGRYLRGRMRLALGFPVKEREVLGQLRAYKRAVDLSASGKRSFRALDAARQATLVRALKRLEIATSKKGLGI